MSDFTVLRGDDQFEDVVLVDLGDGVRALRQMDEDGLAHTVVLNAGITDQLSGALLS